MPYVNVEETTLYYEVKGQGIPLIFIHPPGMGHVTFKEQAPLSENFQVITFDIRGHGHSGYVKDDYLNIAKVTDDLIEILNHLNLNKAIICGYSNGGSIALNFALKYPERTEALVISGAFSEVNSMFLRQEFNIGIYFSKLKALPLFSSVLSRSHTKKKEYRKELSNYIKQTNPESLYQLYVDGLLYNCSDHLKDLKCPVLLIYGSRDIFMHHYQENFLNNHPKTRVVYISGVGHQVPTKRHNEFNRVVTDFVHAINFREEGVLI